MLCGKFRAIFHTKTCCFDDKDIIQYWNFNSENLLWKVGNFNCTEAPPFVLPYGLLSQCHQLANFLLIVNKYRQTIQAIEIFNEDLLFCTSLFTGIEEEILHILLMRLSPQFLTYQKLSYNFRHLNHESCSRCFILT